MKMTEHDLKTCKIMKGCTCHDNASIFEVAKELKNKQMRYMLVLNSKEEPVGIISAVDISNKVVAEGKNPSTTIAKDIMSKELVSVEDCSEIELAYEIMLKTGKNFIPVVNNKKFIGLLDMYDVAVAIAKKHGQKI